MTEDETGDTDNKGVARFTPTRTVFYDGQKKEMAVLSNRELIIDGIVCGGNFYLGRTGGFVISTSSETGLSIKPTGRVI